MEVRHFLFLQTSQSQMKSKHLLFISFFIFLLTFLSCNNHLSDNFEIIKTDSPFDFHAITLHHDIIYATGGDVWNKCNLLTSSNGLEWTLDSLTNKSIFDLYSNGQTLYGVGTDGYIFFGQDELKLSRTKYWGMLRACAAMGNEFIAVGGKDFNKGWIYKINQELQVDSAFTFDNEILDVLCYKSNTCIACGYGIILTSNDLGLSWQRSPENGDYYNSIAMNANEEIFIVGYNGTIVKSSDLGKTWNKLKNGHSPLATNNPFRTIKFHENKGVIVGDNGLILISYDDGNQWENISIDSDLDLFDFVFFQSKIVVVAESGQIINLNI